MSQLYIRVFSTYWTFESPPGVPFDLEMLPKSKREGARDIFGKRYDLSPDLVGKVKAEIKYQETTFGQVKQFVFGILLPAGLLLGNTFEFDRDVTILKAEVAQVLSAVFAPNEYRLIETIQDGKFSAGRVLLTLSFQ